MFFKYNFFLASIKPVLLPIRGQNTNVDNTVGRLTGWGKVEDGENGFK